MTFLFILVFAGIGAVTAKISGLLLGALCGYLLSSVIKLRSELNDVKRTVQYLSARDKLQPRQEAEQPQRAPPPVSLATNFSMSDTVKAEREAVKPAAPVSAQPKPSTAPVTASSSTPTPATAPKPDSVPGLPPTRGPSDTYAKPEPTPLIVQWITDYFTGGNTLVRVGVVILFFGLVFLVKYAAEQGFVPIELRMAAVALGGLALLVVGWRTRLKNAGFSLALQGGGVAVIYLTSFAAMRLYDLIPPGMAFTLLLITCALSAALAVLQDSKALALLGFSGGFVAPVLTSSGGGSHVMLFSYFALLNTGILAIAWYKSWRALNLVGFVFTFVIGTTWGVFRYQHSLFASTEPFLVLFFVFYVAISVLFALRQPVNLRGYVDGTLVFGTPVIVFGLQYALVRQIEFGLAYSAIAACVFYVFLAYGLFKYIAKTNSKDGIRLLCESFLAIGVVFGTVAIPLALDDQWTSATWALEGVALIYIAIKQGRVLPYFSGLLLQLGAAWFVLKQISKAYHESHLVLLNSPYVSGLLMALAGCLSAYLIFKNHSRIRYYMEHTDRIALAWGLLWWLFSGLFEIHGHTPIKDAAAWLLLFGSVTALLVYAIGSRYRWQDMQRLHHIILLFLGVGAIYAVDDGRAFEQWNLPAWLGTLTVFYWLLKRNDYPELSPPGILHHVSGAALILLLSCLESHWWIKQFVPMYSSWPDTVILLIPALALVTILKARNGNRWPFAQHRQTYFQFVCSPLAVYVFVFIFLASISHNGNAAPLDYFPFLNPLDLSFMFGYLCLGFWGLTYIKHERKRLSTAWPTPVVVSSAMAALAFILINSALLRTIHHWSGMPFNPDGIMRSDLAQMSLSILWAVVAVSLMVLANRKQWRIVWMTGAGLIAVVVLKLFVLDLANVGTVERIVSFIGVGLLMLGVGYFAALPPKKTVPRSESATQGTL
ncbi:MAG: DUF2339 domain-containing protein [Gammaproteobacteria bacterium]|nr:DUF2339 domain-containing protein [Gammaproteobacteria bacterium]MDH5802191.1 DUF2339 domain-containing protein [Gammaproteobacteria bacterium]